MTAVETIAIPTSVFGPGDWTLYRARLEFTGRLVGGIPGDPALMEAWLTSKLGIDDAEQLKAYLRKTLVEVHGIDPADATQEEIEAAIEQSAAEKKAQVFKRLDRRPYVEGRHVKAMLKEATNISYPRGEHKWGQYASRSKERAGQSVGGKAPVDFLAERVCVPERPIVVADEITDVDLAVGHIRDPRSGDKRSTLGYFEYVERPVFDVELEVLDDCLTQEQWARIWQTAERNGLGARRSQGAGQFVVTSWERCSDA